MNEIEEEVDKIKEEKKSAEEFKVEEKPGNISIPGKKLTEAQELFIDAKKTEMFNLIDSGELKVENQKYGVMDAFVTDMVLVHPSQDTFVQYMKDQKQLKDKMNDITKQIIPMAQQREKLFKRYQENAKDMLEQIRLL